MGVLRTKRKEMRTRMITYCM